MNGVYMKVWALSALMAALVQSAWAEDTPAVAEKTGTGISAVQVEKTGKQPLQPERAVAIALAGNPGLAEMQARAKALAAVPSQVATLPDPTLSMGLKNMPTDSFSFSQEAMTVFEIGFSQALPYPGKLALREKAAAYEAEGADASVEELRLALARDVRMAWWNLFYLDHALEITDRNQQLMRQFIEVAQIKYAVGKGLQQDVLLAQTELAKLLDMQIQLKGMRRVEETRLNALLNRPTMQEITLPNISDAELREITNERELLQQAEEHRPLLLAQRSLINAAQARVDLSHKDHHPDFSVGVAYGARNGLNPDKSQRADLASLLFSMSLPIYSGSKQDKAVDQRNAELLKSQHAFDDARIRVQREVSTALAEFQQARSQYGLLRDGIIPQTQQTVAAMLAGYQVNKVDFLNLVNAQVNLYSYETKRWKTYSAANQSLARLAAAVGKENINE